MAQNLKEYIRENKCEGFTPKPRYCAEGDFVSYFLKDDPCFAQRVDELVTVYHANETNELVGCKIKGVRRILRTLGDFGVSLEDGQLCLSLFFMAASMANPTQEKRYKRVGRLVKDALVDMSELESRELQLV
jgi:hypothetical protein